jgi:hypothetical protein
MEKDYEDDRNDAKWAMTAIAMINMTEYRRLTRNFRKGNVFNAYEHYMHRNDKVPAEH